MASQQLQKVLDLIRSVPPAKPDTTVAQMRGGMEKVAEKVAPDVKCEKLEAGGVPAEWICAPGAAEDRVILYLHGGGYVMGSINTHRAMIARISRAAKAKCLALDYRLAPEHPFPAAVEDATAAYRWLLAQGYKPGKIAISGDSAGGGLTLATLLKLRDDKVPLPACAVPISAWSDMEGTGESMKTRAKADPMVGSAGLFDMAKAYVGNADPKNPLASPLHGDYTGLPPMLIQVGDAETLLDDSTRVAAKAKAAGVKVDLEVWPEMIHVWHVYAKLLPEGQQAIDRIGQYVIEHTA
ncbi:MAG TPA: alpha/beta hydrolase [Candidatus Binataceae bacterium]|jgi:acetyl esterase/lipase|nr:alpha/beta hydrolase [Candidatus Binataceae bacterium]